MTLGHLNLYIFLRKSHNNSPIRVDLMLVMMLLGDVAVDHPVHLVVVVRIETERPVIPVGHVRPDGAAEVADVCGWWGWW